MRLDSAKESTRESHTARDAEVRTREEPGRRRNQGDRRGLNPPHGSSEKSSIDPQDATKQGASSTDDVAKNSTFRHASQREKPEPSDAELEAAIVAAMLDNRGTVAEMLAERLKERRHARAGVPTIGKARDVR